MNVEQFINMLEILHRKRDALVPNVRVLFVAGLKFDQFPTTSFAHRRIRHRSCVCFFVGPNELGKRVPLQRLLVQQVFPAPYHHPKLRSPIADVIISNDVVSEKARDPRQHVTERGAANVTDVHRLGHVR